MQLRPPADHPHAPRTPPQTNLGPPCCALAVLRLQITVSTVGLIPEMRQFSEQSKAVMAVSLHATTDEVGPAR